MRNQNFNLDETMQEVRVCATRMNAEYGNTVFDEWAVISLRQNQPSVLAYAGPRGHEFRHTLTSDLGALRGSLKNGGHAPGEFEFARHAVGTGIEGFMALGNDTYLLCNNTRATMNEIAGNPRWLSAQVAFADLSEKICARSF